MNIKPVNNWVLLRNLPKNKNLQGIILLDTNKELSYEGIIININNNDVTKSEFKIGDHVIYNKYSGQELKIDNEDFILIKQNDILAILN